ncbi:MAG: hypothetical protein U9R44_00325 [Candidatus Omnitrophota bacterium]|nr:hypothetical protein [Candidatus Omnitrophota bacterium]
MTQLRELYRCEICGNIVKIAHEGALPWYVSE